MGEDITFQPESLSLALVYTGETLNGTDQQTARRPPETSPSSSCSFNTSGEQHSYHKVNSNILTNATVSIKEGPYICSQIGQIKPVPRDYLSSFYKALSPAEYSTLETDAALRSGHQYLYV